MDDYNLNITKKLINILHVLTSEYIYEEVSVQESQADARMFRATSLREGMDSC